MYRVFQSKDGQYFVGEYEERMVKTYLDLIQGKDTAGGAEDGQQHGTDA